MTHKHAYTHTHLSGQWSRMACKHSCSPNFLAIWMQSLSDIFEDKERWGRKGKRRRIWRERREEKERETIRRKNDKVNHHQIGMMH